MTARMSELSDARSRSISAENPTGTAGGGGRSIVGTGAAAARELGVGWKVSPSVEVGAGEVLPLADIEGPGRITHLWLTVGEQHWRSMILRFYWDDAAEPAVEVPLGDFFCQGWGLYAPVSSEVIVVTPRGGFNSYWEMPFRRRARMTVSNVGDQPAVLFYQVDFAVIDLS